MSTNKKIIRKDLQPEWTPANNGGFSNVQTEQPKETENEQNGNEDKQASK